MATLPKSFPTGTRFADVEDVPVTCSPDDVCTAWDWDSGPRPFSYDSFRRNGSPMSESAFRAWLDGAPSPFDGAGNPGRFAKVSSHARA